LNADAAFANLIPTTAYYGRVRALNHSGIATAWTALGSTTTLTPNAPTNLRYTGATTSSLTAAWDAPIPAGDNYTLQIATSNDFGGTLSETNVAALNAMIGSLAVNTTYYG